MGIDDLSTSEFLQIATDIYVPYLTWIDFTDTFQVDAVLSLSMEKEKVAQLEARVRALEQEVGRWADIRHLSLIHI